MIKLHLTTLASIFSNGGMTGTGHALEYCRTAASNEEGYGPLVLRDGQPLRQSQEGAGLQRGDPVQWFLCRSRPGTFALESNEQPAPRILWEFTDGGRLQSDHFAMAQELVRFVRENVPL
jgi:hypothetical protein